MFNRLCTSSKKAMAGIDIGTCFIKTLLLSRQDQHYSVDSCAVESVPAHYTTSDSAGHIIVSENSTHDSKKTLSQEAKTVIAAVSGATVISRIIVINNGLTDSELSHLVLAEAEKLISYSLHDVYMDFCIIGPCPSDRTKSEVLLCIARADTVKHKLLSVQQQGMIAGIIDIEHYALARAATLCFGQLPDFTPQQYVLLLDIGASQTLFCVMNTHSPVYCHDISSGLADLSAVQRTDAPVPERLLLQIRQHLQRFCSQQHTMMPDYLLLSGGAALITGVKEYLQHQLCIFTMLADPFRQMHFHRQADRWLLQQQGARFMVACGLAMRGI